jgi:zinc protease
MRHFWTVFFLGAIISCSSSNQSSTDSTSTSRSNSSEKTTTASIAKEETLEPYPGLKIEHVELSNGLNAYLIPREQNGTVGVVVGYEVGSRFETVGRTGLAHLFEHMMFRGTESFPQPFQTLSEWSGHEFNAFTSDDQTVYHEMVPLKNFEEALKFESERMRKLLITPQGFNTERGAVVSERKMNYEDSPGGRLHFELYQTAFDKHPYKTTPIGWQDDIEKASFEDALSFYHRYYAPNRASIVLIGDIKTDETKKLLLKYFGPFESVPFKELETPQETLFRKNRKKTIRLKTQAVFLGDAAFSPSYKDQEAFAELFMCVLFADSTSGYLQHALVEKGIARSVSASCYPSVDPGLSTITVVGVPKVSAATLEKKYEEAKKGFLAWAKNDRFENIKKYFEISQLESMRSPMDFATSIASNAVTAKDPLYSFKLVEAVKKLKFEDIEKQFKTREKIGQTRVLIVPAAKNDPMKKDKNLQKDKK